MRKRLELLFLLSAISLGAVSQTGQGGNWGGGADEQVFSPGFVFQYVSSEYKILKKTAWRDPFVNTSGVQLTDTLRSVSSPATPGFGLGFVAGFRLGEHTDLRITPTLVFLDRTLDYVYKDPSQNITKIVPTTTVDFPVGIKLKSDRRLNFRSYILAGGKYSMDIISKKKTDDSNMDETLMFVKNKKGYFSYEVAIGFDFYFEWFKLSPEFKLSNSIGNMLKREDHHPSSRPLEKLYTRNFQFSLYFE